MKVLQVRSFIVRTNQDNQCLLSDLLSSANRSSLFTSSSIHKDEFLRKMSQEQPIHTIDFNQYLDGVFMQPTLHSHPPPSIQPPPSLRQHISTRSHTHQVHPGSANHTPGTQSPLQLDSFVQAVVNPTPLTNQSFDKQSAMRTLNGTWFKSTPDSHLPNAMTSSLAVRKQRNSLKHKERQAVRSEGVDFTKEYQQQGIFPSRSAKRMQRRPSEPHHVYSSAHRSPFPHEEGQLKMKIIKTVKHEGKGTGGNAPHWGSGGARSGRNTAPSSLGKHRPQPFIDVFSNNGILGAGDSRPMVKGTRMHLHE